MGGWLQYTGWQCREDETQGISRREEWGGHSLQRELGGNDSYLRQASYSCAHRCASLKTDQPDGVQRGDQWEMPESALVGPDVSGLGIGRYGAGEPFARWF